MADMAAALARVSYQSAEGASHLSTVRGLPQQQQLHLLALATAVATAAAQAAADAEAEASAQAHGISTQAYRAKYYWGPASLGPKPLKTANPFADAAGKGTALFAGDAARAVPLARAYEQYRLLSSQMFQQPVSEQVRGAEGRVLGWGPLLRLARV